MKKINLYISVGLHEGVKPEDFTLTVDASEMDGVDIIRNATDSMDTFYINSEETFILGRKEEDIQADEHELIIELEVAISKEWLDKDVSFIIYDHNHQDGFIVAIDEDYVDKSDFDDSIVNARESYINKRIKG